MEDVERLPTILGVIVLVVAVAWISRVPVGEDDLRPEPTPPPSTEPSEQSSEESAGQRWRLTGLDASSLRDVGGTVYRLGPHRIEVAASGTVTLVEPDDGGRASWIRRVDDSLPVARRSVLIPTGEGLTWLDGVADTYAWATSDGRLTGLTLGSGRTTGIRLPDGQRMWDAVLLDERRLAVLTLPDERLAPWVHLYDIPAAELRWSTRVVEARVNDRDRLPRRAWDPGAERLYLLVDDVDRLIAVDLGDGDVVAERLPTPLHREDLRDWFTRWTVDAAGGRVVVSGVDRTRDRDGNRVELPLGVLLFDSALQPLAQRPDGPEVSAVLPPSGDRVLATTADERVLVLDGSLDVDREVFAGTPVTTVGFGDDHAYVERQGERERQLLALDLDTGHTTGSRLLSEEERFLPGVGALVSPLP